jgi:release factor glutamine methyltransferase
VLPGVFHPGTFLSTNLLIDFLSKRDLSQKTVLELGAGSGMISFYLAQKKGAIVTASDINPTAIEGLNLNNSKQEKSISIVQSDLFKSIDPNDFFLIIINPPYYPKDPASDEEYAFYCGEDFNYFHNLFEQLSQRWTSKSSEILMILSEDCALDQIRSISEKHQLKMTEIYRCKKRQEWNYLFNFERHE